MHGFFMNCARGALGLGAAALLLTGISAQAGAASRASQPLLLAQSTAPQEEAAQLEQRRQAEQKKAMQQKDLQMEKKAGERMRGPMPKSAAPAPAAVPPQPGSKRFGAGVVRHGDDPGDSGQME